MSLNATRPERTSASSLLRCQPIPASQTGQRVLYQTVSCGMDIWRLHQSDVDGRHEGTIIRQNRGADLQSASLTPQTIWRKSPAMAKKPGTNPQGEFAFFNVTYEDGSQRSNRRVPAELLGGLDGDDPARGFIMEQDREIAEKSGRAPLKIKTISRAGAKKKKPRSERPD